MYRMDGAHCVSFIRFITVPFFLVLNRSLVRMLDMHTWKIAQHSVRVHLAGVAAAVAAAVNCYFLAFDA